MRPKLYVLAGVNGAGKSSVGGALIRASGRTWYNPDTFARMLVQEFGMAQEVANSHAWQEGMRRLDEALKAVEHFAFETTLGGQTVTRKLANACESHDVILWFCGLSTPEHHIARVRARVRQGGHPIAEEKIRERWIKSRANLIALLPRIRELQVLDNSAEAAPGAPVQDPIVLLHMQSGRRIFPATIEQAADTPDWARGIIEAAFELDPPRQL